MSATSDAETIVARTRPLLLLCACAVLAALTALVLSGCPPGGDVGDAGAAPESCEVTGCAAGFECVLDVRGDAGRACVEAVGEGECCRCHADQGPCSSDTRSACDIDVSVDGCADGLVCVGQTNSGDASHAGSREPICLPVEGRVADQRCNVDGDECAPGFACGVGTGICHAEECSSDLDCADGLVCARSCGSTCEPPGEVGDICVQDPIEDCGFTRACADGLTCAGDDLYLLCSSGDVGEVCVYGENPDGCRDGLVCIESNDLDRCASADGGTAPPD